MPSTILSGKGCGASVSSKLNDLIIKKLNKG